MSNTTAWRVSLAAAIVLAMMQAVHAHHGWSWTTGDNVELDGTIVEARLGNPHGVLVMDVDGDSWRVEVGQPWRNARAGLEDGDLAPGVTLRVSGQASRDAGEMRLKAERLWIGETLYELYPERD